MDKIVIIKTTAKLSSEFDIFPGKLVSYSDIPSFFYFKGFLSEKEIIQVANITFGEIISILDPPTDENDLKSIPIHDSCCSAFVLKVNKKYYLIPHIFSFQQKDLLFESSRTILIMGNSQKIKFTSDDYEMLSCIVKHPIHPASMMFSSIVTESPVKMIEQVLSMKDDFNHTRYTFLLNEMIPFRYICDLFLKNLSYFPFAEHSVVLMKDGNDFYKIAVDEPKSFPTIKFTNMNPTYHELPILAINY